MTDQEYDALPVGTRFWLAEYGRLDSGQLVEVRLRVAEKMAKGKRWLAMIGEEIEEQKARIVWPSKSGMEFAPYPPRCFLSLDQARLHLSEVIESIHRGLLAGLESTSVRAAKYSGRIGPKTTMEKGDEAGVPVGAV